jgi:mono/diheme cytochrome c family protein
MPSSDKKVFRGLAAAAAICALSACSSMHGSQGNANKPAPVAESVDPAAAAGAAYAKQACASCHAVGAGETKSPNASAPAFQTVADTPGMTAMALNAWLHGPHKTMPSLIIDPARIDDLSAYIGSLKSSAKS